MDYKAYKDSITLLIKEIGNIKDIKTIDLKLKELHQLHGSILHEINKSAPEDASKLRLLEHDILPIISSLYKTVEAYNKTQIEEQKEEARKINIPIQDGGGTQVSYLVLYFAEWCGHCKRYLPKWEELKNKVENSNIVLKQISCVKHKDKCASLGITSYPTIRLYHNKKEIEFSGSRDDENLNEFIKKHTSESLI